MHIRQFGTSSQKLDNLQFLPVSITNAEGNNPRLVLGIDNGLDSIRSGLVPLGLAWTHTYMYSSLMFMDSFSLHYIDSSLFSPHCCTFVHTYCGELTKLE